MLKPTKHTLRKYKIAVFNQRLHENGICPANHNVEYANGWYYYDGEPQQRPEITRRAKELWEKVTIPVWFNEGWNTYVLRS